MSSDLERMLSDIRWETNVKTKTSLLCACEGVCISGSSVYMAWELECRKSSSATYTGLPWMDSHFFHWYLYIISRCGTNCIIFKNDLIRGKKAGWLQECILSKWTEKTLASKWPSSLWMEGGCFKVAVGWLTACENSMVSGCLWEERGPLHLYSVFWVQSSQPAFPGHTHQGSEPHWSLFQLFQLVGSENSPAKRHMGTWPEGGVARLPSLQRTPGLLPTSAHLILGLPRWGAQMSWAPISKMSSLWGSPQFGSSKTGSLGLFFLLNKLHQHFKKNYFRGPTKLCLQNAPGSNSAVLKMLCQSYWLDSASNAGGSILVEEPRSHMVWQKTF